MCGIAGTWGSHHPDTVEAMLERLVHRGPDAGGIPVDAATGTLGHRRLSIVAAGRDFLTHSDNEVILHVLAGHDPNAITQVTGMFAFALSVDGELLLGRDPLGIKPLYVGRIDGDLVFGSELRAFPAGSTDLAALPPGTIWSSRTGGHRYWSVPDPARVAGDLDLHAARVRESLEARVPFLDTAFVGTALSIPANLRRPDTGRVEKTVLRMAVEDLLPDEIVWRDKAKFDEGSGTADVVPTLSDASGLDAAAVERIRTAHPGVTLRSAEECWYLQLLLESSEAPDALLPNVARWTDR